MIAALRFSKDALIFIALIWFKVLICQNGIRDQKHLEDTLVHEMIHMYDYCRAEVDFKDCSHIACTEVEWCMFYKQKDLLQVRAATLSRDCSWNEELRRGNFGFVKHFQKCVKRRSLLSLKGCSSSIYLLIFLFFFSLFFFFLFFGMIWCAEHRQCAVDGENTISKVNNNMLNIVFKSIEYDLLRFHRFSINVLLIRVPSTRFHDGYAFCDTEAASDCFNWFSRARCWASKRRAIVIGARP